MKTRWMEKNEAFAAEFQVLSENDVALTEQSHHKAQKAADRDGGPADECLTKGGGAYGEVEIGRIAKAVCLLRPPISSLFAAGLQSSIILYASLCFCSSLSA